MEEKKDGEIKDSGIDDSSEKSGDAVENENKNKSEVKKKSRKKKETFKEKLADLWIDKRSFKKRLFNSILPSFAFAYIFMVFAPLELYLSNVKFFSFGIKYLIPVVIVSGITVFAVLTFGLALLKGKIHNNFVSLLLGITLAGFIQGTFLNINQGTFDGSDVPWQDFRTEMLLNILFWVVVVSIPFIVRYFSPKIWKYGIKIVSGIMIVAQLAALTSVIISSAFEKTTNVSEYGYLDADSIYEVSPENNVIVFLLDRFDKDYAEELLKDQPELYNDLGGFTFYENFTGSYSRTFPSVAYLLTGKQYKYEKDSSDYLYDSWTGETYISEIKNAGCSSKVYTEVQYVMGSAANAIGKVDNAIEATNNANYTKIFSVMMTLTGYRYVPEAMKPYFRFYTGDVSAEYIFGSDSDTSIYSTDDADFYSDLKQKGVSIGGSEKGSFIFYHLQGAHNPFNMDENGNKIPEVTLDNAKNRNKQVSGNFKMIRTYIDDLKELGLYDDTTIIITADHGKTGTVKELKDVRVPTLMVKEAGADTSVPLKRSQKQLSQSNLIPSFLEYLGIDHSEYGRSINDIGEDENVARYFYMSGCKGAQRDYNLIIYEINGDANDFDCWTKVSTEKMQYPFYDP